MLLICIAIGQKIASISNAPKSLKGRISKNPFVVRIPNLAQIYLKECLIQAKCYYGFIFQYLVTMATNMT